MTKKILKIIGTSVALALYFILYFLYDKFPCFLTSIFSPTNNTILEYIKVLFGCIMFSGVIQKIIILTLKLNFNNNCFSNFVGAISSIPIFLIMYIPIYFIIGQNTIIKFFITFTTIIIAEIIAYKIMLQKDFKLENKTILFVIIIYLILMILTNILF